MNKVLFQYCFLLMTLMIFSSSVYASQGTNDIYERAEFQFQNGEYGKAYEEFINYLSLQESILSDSLLVREYMKVGLFYKNHQVFDIALDLYQKSIPLIDSNQRNLSGDLWQEMGGLYYDQGDYENASEYYRRSYIFFSQTGRVESLASAYNNLGEMYRFQSQYDSAIIFYNKSLKINEELDREIHAGINLGNLGLTYQALGEFVLAKEYFEKQLSIRSIQNHELLYCSALSTYGHYFLKIKDWVKAEEFFFKAMEQDLNEQPKKEFELESIYKGLYTLYSNTGQYAKELKYYKLWSEVHLSIKTQQRNNKLIEVRARYESLQRDRHIRSLKEEAEEEIEQKQLHIRNMLIVISFLALVVILAIIIIVQKSKSQKQRNQLYDKNIQLRNLELEKKEIANLKLKAENKELEARETIERLKNDKLVEELDHKERELSTSTMHVMNKNQILASLKEQITTLNQEFDKETQKSINVLIREIDNNIDLDKDWKAFKMHFDNVHQGFFVRLKEGYPDLTPDEMKLCAYLRINLSSKEIAQILNITQIAINKRRNRLRKKLSLEPSQDLIDFVSRI